MTVALKQKRWTAEEFLAWHERQEERYELVGGYPVLKSEPVRVMLDGARDPKLMTGASRQHNEVSAALLTAFRNLLKGKSCRAYVSDAAVRTSVDQIRYPDLVVDRGTPSDRGYVFELPILVVEVLSPSTKSFDLTRKMTEYWGIATLKYIMVVDPESRRIQLHSRLTLGAPVVELFDSSNPDIELSELGISLPFADIFEGLAPTLEQ